MDTANRERLAMDSKPVRRTPIPPDRSTQTLVPEVVPAVMAKSIMEPHSVEPGNVLGLQRLVGNRAVAGLLARRTAGFGGRDANGVAAGADEAVSLAAASPGVPLPEKIRSDFERSVGTGLSSVRVHTGAESAVAAEALGAQAYTVGQDIHFGSGFYAPSEPAGIHLLAHEVAHTLQNQGGSHVPQTKLQVSSPGDAAEVEAERAADAIAAGFLSGSVPRDMRAEAPDESLADQRDGALSLLQINRNPPDGDGSAAAVPASAAPATAAPAAATPVAVRNGPSHAPIDTATTAGMSIAITITSSSGVDSDMSAIQDSEQVSLSYGHTGCFTGMAALPSNQSGFMPGYPIPDDQHGTPKSLVIDRADNHGGDGQFDKNQLDIYTGAGVTTATAIPASGYRIRRIIKTGPGTKIVLRTEKSPNACSVNGYTTTAGPSPTQADEVTVRS